MITSPRLPLLRLLTALLFTALVAQAAPKRVIVVTVTTGYRHGSIATAEKVLQKLADDSKAFEIVGYVRQPDVVVPRKPNAPKAPDATADAKAVAKYDADLKKYQEELAKFDPVQAKLAEDKFNALVKQAFAVLSPENLIAQHIDGVIFANTTGNLPLPDKDGFIAWIESGKGFIGMHSATDTLHEFKPYGALTGGEFDGHPWHEDVDIKVEDPKHPAAGDYRQNFVIKDEIYQFKNWDRKTLHVILSLDPSNASRHDGGFFARGKRADNDYAVSWVRTAGKGRVFYTSLGHRDEVWNDGKYQAHVLGGIKWALGLSPGAAQAQ